MSWQEGWSRCDEKNQDLAWDGQSYLLLSWYQVGAVRSGMLWAITRHFNEHVLAKAIWCSQFFLQDQLPVWRSVIVKEHTAKSHRGTGLHSVETL